MQVNLIPYLNLIEKKDILEKTVLVLDILRATSTIVTALENGAARVIPVSSATEAGAVAAHRDRCILAGEREGVKIKGFNLGNSPVEFTTARVAGKNIIHCTTNGTRAILLCSNGEKVIISSLLNRQASLQYAADLNRDLVIVCAGRKNGPATEDTLGAGALVALLRKNFYNMSFSKLSLDAYLLYKLTGSNLYDRVYKSPSGQNLISMGLKTDIDFCLRKDVSKIVPLYGNGEIISAQNKV